MRRNKKLSDMSGRKKEEEVVWKQHQECKRTPLCLGALPDTCLLEREPGREERREHRPLAQSRAPVKKEGEGTFGEAGKI